MSAHRILILLGILIALAPFIGVPLSFLRWLLPLLGLGIGAVGYVLRTSDKKEVDTVSLSETLTA